MTHIGYTVWIKIVLSVFNDNRDEKTEDKRKSVWERSYAKLLPLPYVYISFNDTLRIYVDTFYFKKLNFMFFCFQFQKI